MASPGNILAVSTFIFVILTVLANCLDIDIQPSVIRPNQRNVVFTCTGANDTKKMSESMIMMRLMKLHNDDQWTELAVLRSDGAIDMSDGNATAVGRLGNVPDSHLVVTWPIAPPDINGKYRCDAVMITNTWEVAKIQSTNLDVESLSTDQTFFLERLRNSEKRLILKLNQTMLGAMDPSRAEDVLSVLDSRLEDFKRRLDNKTATTITKSKQQVVETTHWPTGRFNLLMSDAGCPPHPPGWIKSFHRMKAVPGDKYYPIDISLHMAKPHKQGGFIYRHFCELPEYPERTKPWPAGSYCLYTMHGSTRCPSGFHYSEAQVKIPKSDENRYVYYYAKYPHLIGTFGVNAARFCCRHDGSVLTPIDLPVSHPFYLHRHGGRCQEVTGMDVTQDVFLMESVDDERYDKWMDDNILFRPDVSFQPYKEELCYYTRKSNVAFSNDFM